MPSLATLGPRETPVLGWRHRFDVRRWLGSALGALVRAWVATLRVQVEWVDGTERRPGRRVLAFFHGQQMALLGARPERGTTVLVSQSLDGEIQLGVMERLGFAVVRGSSSRGGASGLRAIVRRLSQGADAALAVDGPRGPRMVAKPGALLAARRGGATLIPVASAARRAWVVGGAWDRFEIPAPFSRVAIVVGAPLGVRGRDTAVLCAAIRRARARAEELVSRR